MTQSLTRTRQEKLGTRQEDELAIHQLKARYCRYVDTKQWAQLRTLFTDDARFEGFGSAPDGSSADQFVAGVSKRLETAISVHHCHMPELAFNGEGQAKGIWAMQDFLQWPSPIVLREAPDAVGFTGYGHYEEAYRRENDQWLICFMRLTRLRVDPVTKNTQWPQLDNLRRASPDWLELIS
ncbi:nuclear transport factor 2 family protein [Orrella marina]|uniref:SnoaL-like domain-containing protein n=1 Tax=Orrella marina TaxID=2163011 RepID=A0A2R4XH76_9BURK|nr:nuclear transport factor 2 family protein [Orrella marina]AWB33162.1 hypothetical protein DBV39_04920 [Orrella marina]